MEGKKSNWLENSAVGGSSLDQMRKHNSSSSACRNAHGKETVSDLVIYRDWVTGLSAEVCKWPRWKTLVVGGLPGWVGSSLGRVSQTRQLRTILPKFLTWENETVSSFCSWCSMCVSGELPCHGHAWWKKPEERVKLERDRNWSRTNIKFWSLLTSVPSCFSW